MGTAGVPTSPEQAGVLLELESVSRAFHDGRVIALREVSLTLARGDYAAVVGPSGSGKSTLLHVMSGLDHPTSGRVLFEGRHLSSAPDWTRLRRQRIGFVFQFFHLLPGFTVEENVELAMFGVVAAAADRRRRAHELLDQVGLSHRARHRAEELSGGEAQRAALARSLANRPDLLLADEPTGNLDSRSAADVIELLERVRAASGLTLVVVTHDPGLAARAARRVHLLDGALAPEAA